MFRLAALIGALLIGSVLFFALDVPRDVAAWRAKQAQIRELQRRTAALQREISQKQHRIEKLRSNRTEQELEIRERQKMLRPGETSFILQEPEKK